MPRETISFCRLLFGRGRADSCLCSTGLPSQSRMDAEAPEQSKTLTRMRSWRQGQHQPHLRNFILLLLGTAAATLAACLRRSQFRVSHRTAAFRQVTMPAQHVCCRLPARSWDQVRSRGLSAGARIHGRREPRMRDQDFRGTGRDWVAISERD